MNIFISLLTAGTIAGLQDEIKQGTRTLTEEIPSTVSVSSGCELFVRFITLTSRLGEEKVGVAMAISHLIVYVVF